VPYRKGLNFTFDGSEIGCDRHRALRNFSLRLDSAKLAGRRQRKSEKLEGTRARSTISAQALDDDLNTAEALAAFSNSCAKPTRARCR
jgi:cysteinyl-tRNA synthetase